MKMEWKCFISVFLQEPYAQTLSGKMVILQLSSPMSILIRNDDIPGPAQLLGNGIVDKLTKTPSEDFTDKDAITPKMRMVISKTEHD